MKRIWPVLLPFLFSACVSNTDFYRLKMEVDDLKREATAAKTELGGLKEQAAVTVKQDTFSAVRESQADMTSRVNSLSSGLQELQGSFEENKFSVDKKVKDADADREVLRAKLNALEENSEKRLKEAAAELAALKAQLGSLEKEVAMLRETPLTPEEPGQRKTEATLLEGPPAGEKIPGQEPQAPAPETTLQKTEKKAEGDAATKAYDAAYEAFKETKYKEAREQFGAFIRDYPKNELTDNAQFWIAETYYAEKYYEDAILAYETMLKKYPESQKTSGALLKQGYSFIEIGDAKTGRIILSRLIEKFPDSKDAELARKKIADLDKKNSRKK